MVATEQSRTYRTLLFVAAIVFAVAAVLYSAAWMYYARRPAPVEIGFDADHSPNTLQVTHIYPNSPAEHVGLRDGDRILAINGRYLTSEPPWINLQERVWQRSHPGQTVALTVQRPGQPGLILMYPVFRSVRGSGDVPNLAQRLANQTINSFPILFLIVGLAVLFFRVEDHHAWLLALVLATFICEPPKPYDFAGAPNGLLLFLLWFRTIGKSLFPALFYFFFAVFPTRSPIERRVPWLKWLLLVLGAVLGFGGFRDGDLAPLPPLASLLGRYGSHVALNVIGYGSIALGGLSLLLNFLSTSKPDDRRKVKVILLGTGVGMAPIVLVTAAEDFFRFSAPLWLNFIVVVAAFAFPLSFAYAVVKHRVMDIPVLLRRSARYLLVERGFAILIAIVSVAVTLWFGEAFARQFSAGSKAAIPVGATLGVLLLSGATQVHRRVRTRLDRAFFRNAYDAQQILANLASKTVMVTSREGLAELLHDQICDALIPQSVFIYLRSADGGLHAYAGQPPTAANSLNAEVEKLGGLIRRAEPLERDPAQPTGTELDALHAECLVPIRGSGEAPLQGLAVLGPRLSEEPYSSGDKRLLASVASQAAIAMRSIELAEKMAERIEAERRSEQEMQIARQVQSRLLPQHAPTLNTLDCAGKCIQTRAVGGDYYDFLEFGSGRLGLVLADISGKGISGALLMANLQANLRSQYALAAEDLPRLLRSVNRLFYSNTESNNYATLFFALYDDDTRALRYVNCGHNPPILLRAGGDIERLNATATVLGLFEEWDCSVEERQLASGDVLVIYTDGISEAAATEEGEEFGEERLTAQIKTSQHQSANQILDEIVSTVMEFSQGEQADDMTLIVARCC